MVVLDVFMHREFCNSITFKTVNVDKMYFKAVLELGLMVLEQFTVALSF